MVTPTNIPYQINSFLAGTLATPRHCSQFHLPKASACALVRPTHERWKRHPHVSHLINFFLLLTTPQKEHTESLSSPMRLVGYLYFTQPKKEPTVFPAGNHNCLRGGCINSGMSQRMPSLESNTVPTSDPRQVYQQANPLTH